MTETLHLPPAKTSYLPGLNTLRAYAALAVIFSHINENIIPLPTVFAYAAKFFIDAQSAVSLFFVLSGFLITYLLLREFDATGTVSVRKFYIRRTLEFGLFTISLQVSVYCSFLLFLGQDTFRACLIQTIVQLYLPP